MGNEVSSFKDYQIGQLYLSNAESPFKVSIAPATNTLDGKKYTTFSYPKERGKVDEGAEKNIEVLRTTRHPHILKYCALFEESKRKVLVTEHGVPLDIAVEQQDKVEILAGIYNILDALLFLHERSCICHSGICVSTIFVTDGGVWKLAAFENSTKVLRLSKQSYENDIADFAEFVLSVLEYLKDDAPTTISFVKRLEEEFVVAENKELTGSLKSLKQDSFFQTPFIKILDGLKNLPLKSSTEKNQFYRTLCSNLKLLPALVVCRRIVPSLFSHMVVSDPIADEFFLKNLFASGNEQCLAFGAESLFDTEYFKKYSLPLILSLYESRDKSVRSILMKYLPLYVDYIDKGTLKNEVLPQLLDGMKDVSDTLVASTFHALAVLVPILGGEDVVGGERVTCFFDRKPDFTRVGQRSSGALKNSKNVSDIIIPIPAPKQLNPKLSGQHPYQIAEEKRQRRLEREKQREEQRKKREQRRAERETAKLQRSVTQSSDENIEVDVLPNSSTNEPIQNLLIEADQENDEDDNNSLPDWEGFEAFSNGSESETKENGRTLSNASKEEDDWGWKERTSSISSTTVSPISPKASHSSFTNPSIENVTGSQKKSPRGMNLSNSKKIKPKSDDVVSDVSNITTRSDENNTPQSDGSNMNKKYAKHLGGEFDIKIDTGIIAEPDYFADMLPSIKQATKTIVIEQKINTISSKFSALDANSEEQSGGWGDDNDDDDGWGDDDF